VLPDVILLDWMLPGESGLALARKWRKPISRTQGVPILMLTARGDEADKVAGLDAGADDYITKPFSTQEIAGAHPRRVAPPRTEHVGDTRGHRGAGCWTRPRTGSPSKASSSSWAPPSSSCCTT
jgi:two-component system phosphate regulon response regulator PhoB